MEEKYAHRILFHCRECMESYIVAGALNFRDVLFVHSTHAGIVVVYHEGDDDFALADAIAAQAAYEFLNSEPKESEVTPYPARIGDK